MYANDMLYAYMQILPIQVNDILLSFSQASW